MLSISGVIIYKLPKNIIILLKYAVTKLKNINRIFDRGRSGVTDIIMPKNALISAIVTAYEISIFTKTAYRLTQPK